VGGTGGAGGAGFSRALIVAGDNGGDG
ncbi:hypothetical protein, partial [Mycobacterium tuberculosis]